MAIRKREQRLYLPVSRLDGIEAASRGFLWEYNMSDIADGWVWALVIIGGPLLLGIFMYMYSGRRNQLTPPEKKASDQAAHKNWGKEEIH